MSIVLNDFFHILKTMYVKKKVNDSKGANIDRLTQDIL